MGCFFVIAKIRKNFGNVTFADNKRRLTYEQTYTDCRQWQHEDGLATP